MIITRIALTNFRCHDKFTAEFPAGINLLLGPNGSGKTSILEAIGIVLFDRSRTGRQYSDAVGPVSGNADIEIEFAGADGRHWLARRRIGRTPRSTTLFVRQDGQWRDHDPAALPALFGFSGGEAEDVFRAVIVAEQNNFVSAFLERPADRERIFNRVFGISHWREIADMAEFETPYRAVVDQIEARLVAQREESGGRDALLIAAERDEARDRARAAAAERERLLAEEKKLEEFLARTRLVADLAVKCRTEAAALEEADADLLAMHAARDWLAENATGLADCAALEREQSCLQRLLEDTLLLEACQSAGRTVAARIDEARAGNTADLATERELVATLDASISALAAAGPFHADLTCCMDEIEKARTELARCVATRSALGQGQVQVADLLVRKEALAGKAARLVDLQSERETLVRAKEESSTRYRALQDQREDLARGRCPLLGESCRNLAGRAGDPAESIDGELARLSAATKDAVGRLNSLEAEMRGLGTCERELGETLAALRESGSLAGRIDGIERELAVANERLAGHEAAFDRMAGTSFAAHPARLAHLASLAANQARHVAGQEAASATLAALRIRLADGATRLEDLLAEAARGVAEEERLAARTAASRGDCPHLAVAFVADSPAIRQALTDVSERLDAQHDFLRQAAGQEALLSGLDRVTGRRTAAAGRLGETQAHLATAEHDAGVIAAALPPDLRADPVAAVARLREQSDAALSALTGAGNAADAFERELELAHKRALRIGQLECELDEARRQLDIVKRLRVLLRLLGPWISSHALPAIARVATGHFRAITGRGERILWTNDGDDKYRVSLAESDDDAGRRDMAQLSGGEQVAVALALRAALVENLSDSRFVIFDEPTINLDAAARRNLADAFKNIFGRIEQAFVITHDDTFEAMADNEIRFAGPRSRES